MRSSIWSYFDPSSVASRRGVVALIVSDYLAAYAARGESRRRLALLFIPRALANPEMHAAALLRVALAGPLWLMPFWRTALIAKHSIDVQGGVEIGPGLRLPHPIGVVFGRGLVIGRNVTIYQYVTIGSQPKVDHLRRLRSEMPHVINPSRQRPCPTIEDDVIILPGSTVVGSITIGRGAVVGAESWVDRDLPSGAVHRGRTQP